MEKRIADILDARAQVSRLTNGRKVTQTNPFNTIIHNISCVSSLPFGCKEDIDTLLCRTHLPASQQSNNGYRMSHKPPTAAVLVLSPALFKEDYRTFQRYCIFPRHGKYCWFRQATCPHLSNAIPCYPSRYTSITLSLHLLPCRIAFATSS